MPRDMDDIVLWPDGTWTSVEEIHRGGYDFMSDDYEVISILDIDRLAAIGLREELGID